MMKRKWKVGDTLWFVPHHGRSGRGEEAYRIIKVGSKWLTATPARTKTDHEHTNWHCRVNKQTMWVDGHMGSLGRCYESRDAYQQARALDDRWHALRVNLHRYSRPDWATAGVLDVVERAIKGGA